MEKERRHLEYATKRKEGRFIFQVAFPFYCCRRVRDFYAERMSISIFERNIRKCEIKKPGKLYEKRV